MLVVFIVIIAAYLPSAASQSQNRYYSSTGTFTSNCAVSDCYACPIGQWNSACGIPGAGGITPGSVSTCSVCTNAFDTGSASMSYTYTTAGGWQNNCSFTCAYGFSWDNTNKKCISTTCSPPSGSTLLTNSNSPSGCTWSCDTGTYASDMTNKPTTCTPCVAGSFSSIGGSTACTGCPTGTYTISTGFSVCSSCQTYADNICGSGRYTEGCGGTSSGTCAACSNSPP
jgi:hypothetical protein